MKKVIGFTKNNEIIVAELTFEKIGNNKELYLSICLDLSKIAKTKNTIKDYDYMYPFFEDVEDLYSSENIFDLCDEYECDSSELADLMTDEAINDYDVAMDTVDCSLYSEILDVDGEEYIFISSSCEKHKTKDEVEEFVDKQLYDDIHTLWENYHLKNIEDNEEAMTLCKSVLDRMKEIDEEVIVDYIRKTKLA